MSQYLYAAENVMVYDEDTKRRSGLLVGMARELSESGANLCIYTAWGADDYKDFTENVHHHVPINISDLQQILSVKQDGDKPVAVIIDGIMAPGGNPMNRLLKDYDVTVIVGTCTKKVRSDPRFTDVWHQGKHLDRKRQAKGYIDVEPEVQESSWWFW